jgi:hypothetical protein
METSPPTSRTVFYSWQSDLPSATNRAFIQRSLEVALQANAISGPIEFATLDRDPGAPNISTSIFGKIASAAAFVADISTVNREPRTTPNPNVLIELGYAFHCLGEDRVILLFNEAHGTLADIPFDLRQHRILSYACTKGDDACAHRLLAANLENQLRSILAIPRRIELDIRVFVQRGFASQGNHVTPTVSVDVQNHSTTTLFLSSIMFEQDDDKLLYAKQAINGLNTSQRVEAGDSYTLVFNESQFLEWISKHQLTCAVVKDKIGRRWSSDLKSFARLVEQIRRNA